MDGELGHRLQSPVKSEDRRYRDGYSDILDDSDPEVGKIWGQAGIAVGTGGMRCDIHDSHKCSDDQVQEDKGVAAFVSSFGRGQSVEELETLLGGIIGRDIVAEQQQDSANSK